MSRKKQKQLKKAVPVAGVVGASMALAGGGTATAAVGPAPDVRQAAPGTEMTFIEEEIMDVSLATFFIFDRENIMEPRQPGVRYARGCGGCGGCRGCARGCSSCRACGGCGGCSCGCCVSWGACRYLC
jgi:hypothetical protein